MMRFGFGEIRKVEAFVRWKFKDVTRQYWAVVYVVGQVLYLLCLPQMPIFAILYLYHYYIVFLSSIYTIKL